MALQIKQESEMRAMVRKQFGGPEVLEVQTMPDPVAKPGYVLIEVRALGLNRAELYMRQGLWGDVSAISGIECVGEVRDDPSGNLRPGQKVAALMGGMGRSIAGSYASLVLVPEANVFPLTTSLAWEDLAAIPESYATAWCCLHRNLQIQAGQRLLIRGGSSGLGRAATDLAIRHGLEVMVTTRNPDRAKHLSQNGLVRVLQSLPLQSTAEAWDGPVDAVLDLVGNSTLLDSLSLCKTGGRVCQAGFLGGLAAIDGFNPLTQMPSGVQLSFFGSFTFGSKDFPLTDVPLQSIVTDVERGKLNGRPARVFPFDAIPQAHALMEKNQANGKLVALL